MAAIIFENIVSANMQKIIKEEVFSQNFPWILLDNITSSEKEGDNLYGLNHTFYAKDKNIVRTTYPYFLPIIAGCLDKLQMEYKSSSVLAGRAFMQLPRGVASHNDPHIDATYPHLVFLYYVNDSDGDTVLFKKETPWETNLEYGEEKFTEIQRITPKQGRCIAFDGSIYHASCSPSITKRCVINFNYKI
jgi:hypothetical protein